MNDTRNADAVRDDLRVAEEWLAKAADKKSAKRYKKRIKRLREELRDFATPTPAAVTVRGQIIRRTHKAILFRAHPATNPTTLADGEAWLAQSQIEIIEDFDGLDTVSMPQWLFGKNFS